MSSPGKSHLRWLRIKADPVLHRAYLVKAKARRDRNREQLNAYQRECYRRRKGGKIRTPKLYPFHGENLSYSQVAARLGVGKEKLRLRIKRHGFEKAVELIESGRRSFCRYVAFGNSVRTITDWCRIFGLSDTTVFSRLKLGWEIHTALTTPSESKHAAREGSLSANARKHGLKPGTVWSRVHNMSMKDGDEFQPLFSREEIAEKASSTRKSNAVRRQLASAGIIV